VEVFPARPVLARSAPASWPSGTSAHIKADDLDPRPVFHYGQSYRSFRGLLEHLTRNQVRFAGIRATVPMLAEPTSTQREAFRLLGAPIPLTLK